MNVFKKVWQRVFMFVFYKAAGLLNWRQPEVFSGAGKIKELPFKMKELGYNDCFVVVDPGLEKLGLDKELIESFKESGLRYTTFDIIEPNPKIRDIELGVKAYNESGSKCICVIGGGSAMDTAKAVGARVVNPNKTLVQMGGLFKVGHKIPTLFAIPTTAGTGSETTVASVVTDENTHHKYAINDLHLIPSYAVLDPVITKGLPNFITSSTGMDALTHAVEGYLACDCPKHYKQLAEEAVEAIFANILEVYEHGDNLAAREAMLNASYKAGVVFTRVGLTYVHPIAHAMGGLYGVAHGLANSIVLPHCLEYYGPCVYKKLARLADVAHISKEGQSEEEKAKAFINAIHEFNKKMNLTEDFKKAVAKANATFSDEDVEKMVSWAVKEADGAYYPPVLLDKEDLKKIIAKFSK